MKKLLLVVSCLLITFLMNAQPVINPCARATDLHIVVIGSSTAAGAGPTNSANAWVNRYRNYIQSINPNNLVTNLAVGGTRTYHIMPDWFVSPTNRPSPNPAKNVTQAISLGADAIIVNMPSNDGASGYSVAEQMFNFRTIASVADSAGVGIWICTTQPRNGLSAGQMNVQTDVRDSIFAEFGAKAIDFWNPFASTGNTILTQWDSGDGVHMNDTAHAVLNQKVIAKGIPNEIQDTLPYTDHNVNEIFVKDPNQCGDSAMQIGVVVTNLGVASLNNENLQVKSFDIPNSVSSNFPLIAINNLGACMADTNYVTVNSYHGVHRNYDAFMLNSNDTDKSNDTAQQYELLTLGHPGISGMNDTVTSGMNATLTSSTGVNDTIVWYDSLTGGSILGYGNSYIINNVTSNQTVYPEAVSGPLHFKGELFTVANTTTDWNGMMFDIVAHNNITIDSLEFKVNTTGWQQVETYNRMGSAVGNEMNSALWTYWGLDSVNAANAGDFEVVRMPAVSLNTNDTLGVYIYMQNSASRLSYLNSAAVDYVNSDISVVNGRGVTHTFGTPYSPRNFSGRVYYHYGFNPQGDCQSNRIAVSAVVEDPNSIANIEEIDLKIVPNPSYGQVQFIGDNIPAAVTVLNIQGQKIKTSQLVGNQISLSELQSGLYFLSFEIAGRSFVHKILLR